MSLYRPEGCKLCSWTGYRGRIGIFELLEGTETIKKIIKAQGSTEEVLQGAVAEGMTTMKQDGILKVFQGLTHIDEVNRVCIN